MTALDTLLSPGARLAPIMAARGEILALTEASGQAVLQPTDPGGLPAALRMALALRAARTVGDAMLADHYRDRLALLPQAHCYAPFGDPRTRPKDPRLAAIVRHADRLAREPKSATKSDVAALGEAGVADADIVRLSELAAYLAYQARVVAGFRLLESTR